MNYSLLSIHHPIQLTITRYLQELYWHAQPANTSITEQNLGRSTFGYTWTWLHHPLLLLHVTYAMSRIITISILHVPTWPYKQGVEEERINTFGGTPKLNLPKWMDWLLSLPLPLSLVQSWSACLPG